MSEQTIVERKYWWDNEKGKTYNTEKELKEAQAEACDPNGHSWESTFSFAVYRCNTCKANYEKLR